MVAVSQGTRGESEHFVIKYLQYMYHIIWRDMYIIYQIYFKH